MSLYDGLEPEVEAPTPETPTDDDRDLSLQALRDIIRRGSETSHVVRAADILLKRYEDKPAPPNEELRELALVDLLARIRQVETAIVEQVDPAAYERAMRESVARNRQIQYGNTASPEKPAPIPQGNGAGGPCIAETPQIPKKIAHSSETIEADPVVYAAGRRVTERDVLACLRGFGDETLDDYRSGRLTKKDAYGMAKHWLKEQDARRIWR